jgi:hypothetical protein
MSPLCVHILQKAYSSCQWAYLAHISGGIDPVSIATAWPCIVSLLFLLIKQILYFLFKSILLLDDSKLL